VSGIAVFEWIALLCLILNGVIDLRTYTAPTVPTIVAGILGITFAPSIACKILSGVLIVTSLLPEFNLRLGGADIDAMILVFAAEGIQGFWTIIFAGIVAVVMYPFIKVRDDRGKKKIPFVFCLAVGLGIHMTLKIIL